MNTRRSISTLTAAVALVAAAPAHAGDEYDSVRARGLSCEGSDR
jgi:hypothetical protein